MAHLALIARHGAAWFRELGTAAHPGTTLVTIGGAVARPGVYEIALGTPIAEAIAGAGDRTSALRAVLVGGYYGSWLDGGADVSGLDHESLRAHGAGLGAGIVLALPADACPAAEVARVVRWMADQNAGQCGPCVLGLDAIAGAGRVDGRGHRRPRRRSRCSSAGAARSRAAAPAITPTASCASCAARSPSSQRSSTTTGGTARAAPATGRRVLTVPDDPGEAGGMKARLTVDPIACTGHGACAELLPEWIVLDDWGYPMVSEETRARRPALARPPRRGLLPDARAAADAPHARRRDRASARAGTAGQRAPDQRHRAPC